MEKIKVVFNTSPLIFLAKLDYLNLTLKIFEKIYIPVKVKEEIYIREDDVRIKVKEFLKNKNVILKGTKLELLFKGLNKRVGKGESEIVKEKN